jgi:hypothetical protein
MKHILFPLSTIFAVLLSACGMVFVSGSGNIVSEAREANSFDQVIFAAPGKLTITQDGTESLEISADDNLMQYIRTRVEDHVLYIEIEPLMTSLQPTRPIRYTLSVKSIEGISLDGSGDIRAEKLEGERFWLNLNGSGSFALGELAIQKNVTANLNGSGSLNVETLTAANLTLTMSGSGDVDITSLETQTLTTVMNGSGKVRAAGKVATQTVQINGSGSYLAAGLESSKAYVSMLGSGDSQVWVTEKLSVDITGSGDVSYKGNAIITQTINGSGNVRSVE